MNLDKICKKNIIKDIQDSIEYSPNAFGLTGDLTGKNVKIAIIGTGLPVNRYVKNFADFDTLVENVNSPYDSIGHSTILAGFLGGSSGRVKGMVPNSVIYNIKAFGEDLYASPSTITASVLWCIIKDVNIIIIPFELDFSYRPLCDALKKANNEGVFILTVPSDWQEEYPITMPIKGIKNSKPFKLLSSSSSDNGYIGVSLPIKSCISLYSKNWYIKASTNFTSLGLAAGVFAALIEKNKKTAKKKHNKIDSAIEVINDIKKISIK
jgi:subtilisin family serine protease